MEHGFIKDLDDDHGSGCIAPDDGAAEVYFHMSQVAEGAFDLLHEGERVEFQVGFDPRAPRRARAERVRPLSW